MKARRTAGVTMEPTAGDHRKLAERQRIAAERLAQEQAEIAREREATAARALAIWKAATEVRPEHPIWNASGYSVATLRDIDARAAAAILATREVERRTADRRLLWFRLSKANRYRRGTDRQRRAEARWRSGSKAGGFWAAQPLPDGGVPTLLIGEGVATVLSAKEASGHRQSRRCRGNLPAAAKAVRNLPAAALLILADLVRATANRTTMQLRRRGRRAVLACRTSDPSDPKPHGLQRPGRAAGSEAVQRP